MNRRHDDFMLPPTPFQDRCDALRTAFSPIAWSPDASANMAKADDAVGAALQDLRDQFADPSPEAIQDAGVKFASGKGVSAARKVLEAPSTDTDRFRALYAAAKTELVRRHDLPEFSVSNLVAEAAEVLQDVLPAMTREAVDSLSTLPEDVVDDLRSGRLRADSLSGLPVQDRPLEHISAIRSAAAAWEPLYSLTGGTVQGRTMWEDMFRAVASGSLSSNPTMTFPEDLSAQWAVFMDTPGMVAVGAGINPVEVVLTEQGTLEPLWDPFGTQADVFTHRVRAAGAATGVMGQMSDVAAGHIYRSEPLISRQAAQRRSRELPLHTRVGLTLEQAVDAALDAHPEFAQDPGELVAATDD